MIEPPADGYVLLSVVLLTIISGSAAAFKEWLEKYGDIVGFYNGAFPVLIIRDTELIKKIQIKDFGNFHSRGVSSGFARVHPINKRNLVNAPGERWKEMRSLLTPAFTTSNMKKATRNDILQLMLNAEAEEGAPVNVHSLAIDYDADSASEKNEPAKIGKNKKRRFLTNEEILSNGLVFFIAGFETTGTAMSFMAYLLAKHPAIQDRLREEVMAVLERDGVHRRPPLPEDRQPSRHLRAGSGAMDKRNGEAGETKSEDNTNGNSKDNPKDNSGGTVEDATPASEQLQKPNESLNRGYGDIAMVLNADHQEAQVFHSVSANPSASAPTIKSLVNHRGVDKPLYVTYGNSLVIWFRQCSMRCGEC
ncbi:hypothetical protein HPB50_015448 [Hyalomma asiaticum]|uniref:Uncharacterized protein n=1 Tax=Hyalomma asiaticum TaxID=266040 RepID=A0ACB7T9W2_HYAAI|nr:hypothetical protein HPB50_015448 [Hyalomma asiaticum]